MDDTQNYRSQFTYVDVSSYPHRSHWRRIHLKDVEKFRQEFKNVSVFTSINRFKNPEKTKGEPILMDFYMDFDDAETKGEQARQEVIKVRDYFYKIGLEKETVHVAFSGNKGFHLTIDAEALKIKPLPNLHEYFKEIALNLKSELGLLTLDTASIYSKRRMWRLLNSRHEETGLYKTELTSEELTLNIEEIRKIAEKPTPLPKSEKAIKTSPKAQTWYKNSLERDKEKVEAEFEERNLKEDISKLKQHPACIADLLQNSIKMKGERNSSTMILSSFFRDKDLPLEEALNILNGWVVKIPDDLTTSDKAKRLNSTKSCVETIYRSPGDYQFQCQYVWARGKKSKRIACNSEKCALHPSNQKPEPLSSFLKRNISPVKYYAENLLPEKGKVIISGDTGLGKSFFVENLSLALASGKTKFLDRIVLNQEKPLKVMLLDGEMPEPMLKTRFQTMCSAEGIKPPSNLFIKSVADMDLKETDSQIRIERWISSLKPNILFLDDIASLWHGDENKKQEVSQFTSYLNTLIGRFGVAIQIVLHWRKPTREFKRGQVMVSGSHWWPGWCDCHVSLAGSINSIIITNEKNRNSPKFKPFIARLNPESLSLEYIGDYEIKVTEETLDKVFSHFGKESVPVPELVKYAQDNKICCEGTLRKRIREAKGFEVKKVGRTHCLCRKPEKPLQDELFN